MKVRVLFSLLFYLGGLNTFAFAQSGLEKITMQLRWHHQYQFAGYYAAKHKGFYQQAGFEVDIRAGGPERDPVKEVLAGRADFAEGNGEVLVARLKGAPLVALAAIFQHSPSVLLTLEETGIERPADLRGKTVMLMGGNADADLIAMFHADGVDIDEVNILKSSYNINDLINGHTIAFNSYLSNEPYYVEQQGVAYRALNPRDYGVDFYSDILFTTQEQVTEDPERVERFKQATLQGWNYAINHSEEIMQLIYQQYNNQKSLHHMRFEALMINSLVNSDLLPIGHIFKRRVEKMADVFIEQKMVAANDKAQLDNFIFSPQQQIDSGIRKLLYVSTFAFFICFIILTIFIKMNRKLKLQIYRREKAERKLKSLANKDSLTGLLNRRAFINCYKKIESMSLRYDNEFTLVLLDLDYFKRINDRFGHDIGDKALVAVAQAINSTIREVDVAARFGGEEFTLLLANTQLSHSLVIVERLRGKLEVLGLTDGNDQAVSVTASFGVMQWQGEAMEEMLKKVDIAMYQAKKLGRNQLRVYQRKSL